MSVDRVQAIVVGAGLMGTWHARAIARAGVTVAAVVDPEAGRAQALAARHRGARPHTRLDDALAGASSTVTGLHVCTPLGTHGPIVQAAISAGCHVLAEKPLAATADETRALFAHADAAGRVLVPVHQFLYQRGMGALRDRLERLGPVVHVEGATASAGAMKAAPDQVDVIVGEIIPHFLALTRRTLEGPLAGIAWSVTRARPGEWRISARSGAASISYWLSMATRPTFAEYRVFGERGTARLDLFHGFGVFEPGAVSRAAKIARPFGLATRSLVAASANLALRVARAESAYPGLRELVRQFYEAVRGRTPAPISRDESIDVAIARDRLIALAMPDARP